jgi:aminoglycoside 3-N-acetyltransferase
MLDELRRHARRTLVRLRNPVGPDETRRALGGLMGDGVDLLFVHSSLSPLGRFTAGIEDVLAALREFSGTLGLPTHSYCYPEIPGEAAPLFDPASTPSQNGLLTEVFRAQSEVRRSVHSTHSLALVGARQPLVEGHAECETPCGADTPYARMIEAKASALMFGVSFHAYTFYHTAEDAAGSPFAYEPDTRDRLRVVGPDGKVQEHVSKRQTRDLRRFAECGDLMERVGLVRSAPLGAGRLLFAPDVAKAHDFLVGRLRKTPDFLYLNCAAPLA